MSAGNLAGFSFANTLVFKQNYRGRGSDGDSNVASSVRCTLFDNTKKNQHYHSTYNKYLYVYMKSRHALNTHFYTNID